MQVSADRTDQRRRVVIVGGGFGGLYAARALGGYPLDVTVVDRENYHLFQPLLYQVATAALSPGDIAEPIRSIVRRHRNVRVLRAEVNGVDVVDRQVTLADGGHLEYDFLILATGSRHAYFGYPEWEALAPGLKTLEDALEIRGRILDAFEQAERSADPAERQALLTFAVVGGGPTGVELAGAIAEIARHTLAEDYRVIDSRQARVLLIEGGPRILAPYTPGLSRKSEAALRRLGVTIQTDTIVSSVTPEGVQAGDTFIPCRTVLWAAGVSPSPLGKALGVETDRSGRVAVEPDLTLPGHPEVYVVGDLALYTHQGSAPLPGLAPVAMQQGQSAARNIWRTAQGQSRQRFHYVNRGTMATIGRAAAVAEIGPFRLWGLIAWLSWLFLHIFMLVGFQNRLLVMVQWAWSYMTWERGARLITHPWPHREVRPGGEQRSGG